MRAISSIGLPPSDQVGVGVQVAAQRRAQGLPASHQRCVLAFQPGQIVRGLPGVRLAGDLRR